MTYWILGRSKSQAKGNVKAVDGKTESPVGTEPAKTIAAKANVEAPPDAKAAPAPDAKGEAKSDAKVAQASDAKARTTSETKAVPAPEAKVEAKSDAQAAPVFESKVQAKPDATAAPVSEAAADTKRDAKGGAAAEVKSKPPPNLTPKLVERVHALYEELGRQDVRAVQELEKSEKTTTKEAVNTPARFDKRDVETELWFVN